MSRPSFGEVADGDVEVVSVVVPMLDEKAYIDACLDGFAAQDHPLDRLEVLVVDGGSTDGSRELVAARSVDEPWIRLVDNPRRKASAAFNRGVEAATGDVVCLFSSHGVPRPDFVRRSLEVLHESGAAGVGGVLRHEGLDPAGNAVGLAMISPVGMASPFRYARDRREVDTIGHPAYRAEVLREVGPFDEELERNSDYELNWRLRDAGHRLVFDPDIVTIYRPRGSLRALGRQFWHYGRWKQRVVRRHPRSMAPRHLVAPAAVLGVAVSPVLSRWRWGRRVVVAGGLGYAVVVATGVVLARPRAHHADPLVLAASFPVMHGAWGAGFLSSLAGDLLEGRS